LLQHAEPFQTGDILRNKIVVLQIRFVQAAKGEQFVPEQRTAFHEEVAGNEIDANEDIHAGEHLVLAAYSVSPAPWRRTIAQ
jgi:hypothetical protein